MAVHHNDALPSRIDIHVGASGHPRPRCKRARLARALQAPWRPGCPALAGIGTARPARVGAARAARPRPVPPLPRARCAAPPGAATRTCVGSPSWGGATVVPRPRPNPLGARPLDGGVHLQSIGNGSGSTSTNPIPCSAGWGEFHLLP